MYTGRDVCVHTWEHGEHYMVCTMEFLQDFPYSTLLLGMLKRVSWQNISIWIQEGIIHVNRVSTEKGNDPEPNDVEL